MDAPAFLQGLSFLSLKAAFPEFACPNDKIPKLKELHMKFNPVTKRWKFFLPVFAALLFFSCRKDNTLTNDGPITVPDFTTKVTVGNVSGFVTNENNNAVQGATVKIGGSTITTDEYGYFEANNVLVVKQAATVTVTQPRYFKGIKTFMAEEGKGAFFRIKLLPKIIAGTVNAASGGTVNTTTGVKIVFPADAIVNAATSSTYSGTVNVAATWLDPTSPELNSIMPGDLRGIDAGNTLKLLTTYGMVAVELSGSSGEKLQLAAGKKANLTFPIPSSILSTAPATIPLWSFDEEKGLWKEEGAATKTGNNYVGDVGHFSFWNCDVPGNSVQFGVTFINSAGNPIPGLYVKLSLLDNPTNHSWGITSPNGYVGGAVFANQQIRMDVFGANPAICNTVIYSQTFSTSNTNISLGQIAINTNTLLVNISGTVSNCSNTAVTSGAVMMNTPGGYKRIPVSAGQYQLTHVLCNGPEDITLQAEDYSTLQESPAPVSLTLSGNITQNLIACGASSLQYLNNTINGVAHNYTNMSGTDSVYHSVDNSSHIINAFNQFGNTWIRFPRQGISTGSNQAVSAIMISFPPSPYDSLTSTLPVTLNITEYGNVGGYISGNYSGSFTGRAPANTVYHVTGSFKAKRRY